MTVPLTKTDDVVMQVLQASHALAAAGQADLVWGHVAVRDPEGRGVWMKAAGWGLDEVERATVVLVSPSGEVIVGRGRRHVEYPIHTQIMQRRPDVGCVVHTHSMTVNAFSSLDVPLRAISHDGVLFADESLARFNVTGRLIKTPELGDALADALGGSRACLLPRHGLVTVGPDVLTAVVYAVLLERACRTQLMAAAAGGPRLWSDHVETDAKCDEVWRPDEIRAGWNYLIRRSNSH